MATVINSTGEETSISVRRHGLLGVSYTYRRPGGGEFTCEARTTEAARRLRDAWLRKTKITTPYNNTGYSVAKIKASPLLGQFRTFWRGRRVEVYAHPFDATKVITVGHLLDTDEVFNAVIEDRESYAAQIDNHDWRDRQ